MTQPKGFEMKKKENLECLLNKSLYGLKQALRQWYKRFDSFIQGLKFEKFEYDPQFYFKRDEESEFFYLLLYVDDMLIASNNSIILNSIKEKLKFEYEMKDLESARNILGMEIKSDKINGKLFLTLESYIEKIVKRFFLHDAKPVSLPLSGFAKLSIDS